MVYITTVIDKKDVHKYNKDDLFVVRSLAYCEVCGRYETKEKIIHIVPNREVNHK